MKTNTKLKNNELHILNQKKLRKKAVSKGVKLLAQETIFLSEDTKFGKNVIIEPYVVIGKKVKIGNNVKIKSFSYIEGALIDDNVSVGPYARLRTGTKLLKGSSIGNFVETKNSKIDKNTKVGHLSYIGDAIVGKKTNIGAGTITCNFDGLNKNKTYISDNVFVGSNITFSPALATGDVVDYIVDLGTRIPVADVVTAADASADATALAIALG